jgi:predicted DNA-binding transcriptional regulator AlpA
MGHLIFHFSACRDGYHGRMTNPTESAAQPRRQLYSLSDLLQITGLSRTTIWRMQREGTFPARRQISLGRVAWVADEVDEWIQAITAHKSPQ